VVNFTSLPLYVRGKNPRYALYRRLDGLQSRSGRYTEQKKSRALVRNRTPIPRSPARSPVAKMTENPVLSGGVTGDIYGIVRNGKYRYCSYRLVSL
jgi:hypothetical protein